jgi:hypothetical protein
MKRTFSTRILPACIALVTGAGAAMAQQSTQITGRITDQSDAVVAGAEVAVTNTDTGIRRATTSNELGYYTVPLLQPGPYRLSIKRQGFRTLNRTGIILEAEQTARVDAVLEIGTLAETVEVSANVSQVETSSATLKEVVDEQRIRELPLNGRDATQLVLLLPGVYATNDTSGLRQGGSGRGIVQPGVASNGARGNMVSYTLDGAFHNDTYTNVALAFPNPDALQEFTVQTNNFSAEYGRAAGAVVNGITKSGTNSFHGTLFEFHRNEALNARNFFASGSDGLKRHQFGGTVGGPVWRDHTFFFFSMQETRQVQTPPTSRQTVLTSAQRRGDFSSYPDPLIDPLTGQAFPGNQIPISRMNIVTKNVLDKMIPLPSDESTGDVFYTVPNTNQLRQIVTRLDHQISIKDTLTGRYVYNYYHEPPNDTPLVFATKPDRSTPNHNLAINHTHMFTPTLLNQAGFSINRRTDEGIPVWSTGYADLGMKNVFSDKPTPEFGLEVSGAFSIETVERIKTSPNSWAITDTLRWTRGKHEVSTGFEYRKQNLTKNYRWLLDPFMSFDGRYTGYGVADFFIGKPSGLEEMAFGEIGEQEFPVVSAFAQDNIKITPRLTLNVGVRYEPFIPYRDKGNRVSVFRPGQQSQVFVNAPNGLLFPGDPGVPERGTNSDLNNIAPRFGFAWSPFGNGKTSVRGAYGIFYDSTPMSALQNVFQGVAPFGTRVSLDPPPGPFDDPFLGANPFPMPFPPPKDVTFPESLFAATFPETFRTGYMQSWNLTIEREVVPEWVVRASYAGSKGTGLLQGWDRNAAVYIPGKSTSTNISERRPFGPDFDAIEMVDSGSNSSYNSLQLTVDKRFGGSFTLQANYTFAKSLDYGSGAGTLWPDYTNPFNFRQDYGLSDFHHKHRFVTSWLWQLPRLPGTPGLVRGVFGGWDFNGALTLQSGPFYTIRSGRDNSLSGVGLDRADLVGDISRSARQDPNRDPVREWFNTKAFAQNKPGTFGTAGRNIIPGPDLQNVDVTVSKMFPIRESVQLQFRSEFFNLLNRTNFVSPRSDRLTSGTFGRLTAAGDPRILQFGLKLRF